MALTYTPDPEIGKPLPAFTLKAVDGKTYTEQNFLNQKPLVLMFICNHCPYVKAIEDRLIALGHDLKKLGVNLVGVCSNDGDKYPDDNFEALKKRALEKSFPFVYLHDATQAVAKTFGAVCTPDFFVYNSDAKLAYRGRLDDNWKEESKVTKRELLQAVELLLKTNEAPSNQAPSMGCSIKWK